MEVSGTNIPKKEEKLKGGKEKKKSFEYVHIPNVTLVLGRCYRSKQMIMASGRPSNFLDPRGTGKQDFLGRSPTSRG